MAEVPQEAALRVRADGVAVRRDAIGREDAYIDSGDGGTGRSVDYVPFDRLRSLCRNAFLRTRRRTYMTSTSASAYRTPANQPQPEARFE